MAQAKGGLAARLDGLANGFHYVAPDGRDMGSNVRHRCGGTAGREGRADRRGLPALLRWADHPTARSMLLRATPPPPCSLPPTPCVWIPKRCRAQAILALLRDEARLAAEREAHARKRGTYQGFSSLDTQASRAAAGVTSAHGYRPYAPVGKSHDASKGATRPSQLTLLTAFDPCRAAPHSSSRRAAAGRWSQRMAVTCPVRRRAGRRSWAAPACGRRARPRASGGPAGGVLLTVVSLLWEGDVTLSSSCAAYICSRPCLTLPYVTCSPCSMEENRRYLAALKKLLELPANRACADCASTDAG